MEMENAALMISYMHIVLLAPPLTTVGLVNPQPKTREELLKCKFITFRSVKME